MHFGIGCIKQENISLNDRKNYTSFCQYAIDFKQSTFIGQSTRVIFGVEK
ncbi:MAG: hypothetical protein ACI82Q_001649 [Nonlabens sp.]|jgi:hypothetical protein